jgi:PAS domain S-box-containing protein
MRNILDDIPVGLSAFDKDLKLVAYNRLFQETLDLPDALFSEASTSFEQIIRFNADRKEYGEGDTEQMVQTIIERARQPELHQFERVRPNGVTLEVRGAPMPGGGFVTTYADISERKRVEGIERRLSAQLRLDEERSLDFSLSASDWFWETDVEHRFCYFSNSFEQNYGQSQDFLIGKSRREILEFGALNPAESVKTHLAQLEAHLPFKNFEYQVRKTAGDVIWVSVSGLPHFDAAGQFSGYRGTGTLISERMAKDEALRQALQLAQAATMAKSRFLATISHEIRTPMNGMLGMAQLLLMPNLSESKRHDYARTILATGQSLLTLLNDILDLSKIEAGKLQLDSVDFAPESLLYAIRTLFSGAAHDKNLQLEHQWQGAPQRHYLADSHRLRQMLSNLVSNAIKFSAHGCIRIEGREIEGHGASALLEFSVSDTGIGVPAEKIDLLFKPFSQTDSSITRQFGGSGLGLSIVSNLAKAMGGHVGVESVAGEGSRFWFRVPVKASAIASAEVEAGSSLACVAPMKMALTKDWKPLDLALFLKLVNGIKPMLALNLFDSIGSFKKLQTLVKGTALETEIQEIATQLDLLRFDVALQRLLQLTESQTVIAAP